MTFEERYEQFRQQIAVVALGQKIVGLDYDDVVSEMLVCLWKAHSTFDPDHGVTFGVYWWSLWLNRKSHLIEAVNAKKRPRTIPTDEPLFERSYDMSVPTGTPGEGVEALVWSMLGSGFLPGEVIAMTGVPRKGYYRLIRSWRTDEVRSMLKGS